MNKLLFLAGEPGVGKTNRIARPLADNRLGFVFNTDHISRLAAKHYSSAGYLGCKWQLWKLEFDENNNQQQLKAAFHKTMEELGEIPINKVHNLIIEGVLSAHPAFRNIMFFTLLELGFRAESVLTLALCLPWELVHQNLKVRGRPEDQEESFVRERSRDYNRRLMRQTDIKLCKSGFDCYRAAVDFLCTGI